MNIIIKATNTTLTPAIKVFIEEKLGNFSKFLRSEEKVYVELEFEKKHQSGKVFRVEVDIQPHGHYAEARGNDFYEAMDLLIPKIKEQLTKEKDKRISLRRRKKRLYKNS